MGLVALPAGYDVTRLTWDLYTPGRIRMRSRGGTLLAPLDPAEPRWHGLVELRQQAVVGDERAAAREMSAFVALMGQPGSTCLLPWGELAWEGYQGEERRSGPASTAPGTPPWTATVGASAVSPYGLCGRYTTARTATGNTALGPKQAARGTWLNLQRLDAADPPNLTLSRVVQVVGVSGPEAAQVLDLLPDPCAEAGDTLTSLSVMHVRLPLLGEDQPGTDWRADWAGPWALEWEEVYV